VCVPFTPDETETPLVVDTNTVLSFSVAVQRFQAVSWRCCQVAQFRSAGQLAELSACDLLDSLKSTARVPLMKPLGLRVTERLNHNIIVLRAAFNVNR